MNQKLWEKLLRVTLKDIFSILKFLAALPIALINFNLHKNLWLFCDCRNEARDNAYWLFKYVRENYPGQKCIFAIDKKSSDFLKVKDLGEAVSFGSINHWIYYLTAQNIISSQKASGPNAAVCYMLDRIHIIKGNKVFLQHGVIKDNISFLYYKYTNIRLFSCSTKRELDYVQQSYGYPEGNVKLLGLCRFDQLIHISVTARTIVIMPTWRKWLSHPTKEISLNSLKSNFNQSDFYFHWMSLLNSDNFISVLDKYNYTVSFYLHREAQQYSSFFNSKSNRISIACYPYEDVQDLLKSSSILITDYSSVAMDFAFMNKPLIYFQFDINEFRCFHLEKGYFDYEKDGFGPVCTLELNLIEEIRQLLENKGKVNSMYLRRSHEFFTLKDNQNCKRTYNAIINL